MKNLLFSLFTLFATALMAQYGIGEKAEDFTLKAVGGHEVSLSDYEGVIVIFTCNTCPFAVQYEDRIIEAHNKFADQGYPVLAINPNDPEVKPGDSFENMEKRAAEKNFPFKYAFDEEQKVFKQFGATRTPHVFLLDSEHVVRYIGALDDNAQDPDGVEKKYLADAIQAVMEGNNPNPAETKAIGCTIKVK